jgi:4-aminobutyrate aminotransferase-like enzyme
MEDNNISEAAAIKGKTLMDALKEIRPKKIAIGEVRGKGLMVGIELVKDAETKTPAMEEANKIRATLREKGVLIGVGGSYGNVLRIQPPLTITDDEIIKVVDLIKDSMKR